MARTTEVTSDICPRFVQLFVDSCMVMGRVVKGPTVNQVFFLGLFLIQIVIQARCKPHASITSRNIIFSRIKPKNHIRPPNTPHIHVSPCGRQ